MAAEIILTKEGKKKIEEELNHLIQVERGQAAERVKVAREYGDLSENAEYDAAKEDQGRLEAKIIELEEILKNSKVIEENEIDLSVVNLGCNVTIYDEDMDEEVTYKLVGAAEANFKEKMISNKSPLGVALLGHKVGERVEVKAPSGLLYFKIINISK